MGMVDVCGYDTQLKYNLCDTCRLCHLILSILKPVFCHHRHIRCAYNFLWYLDLQVLGDFRVYDDDNMVVQLLSYYRHCIATHLCYHGYATVYQNTSGLSRTLTLLGVQVLHKSLLVFKFTSIGTL